MERSEVEAKLRTLVNHAWDEEVRWPQIEAWAANFNGKVLDQEDEQLTALFSLTRFMYFGRRMVREMLKSLYRDHFEAPLMQRIRRNYGDTKDVHLLRNLYKQELAATRFVGVGNPSESGAHLLYYFRQVNYLSKDLFIDFGNAFTAQPQRDLSGAMSVRFIPRISGVSRFVFFDDLVGSGSQADGYLASQIAQIKRDNRGMDLRFMCLFGAEKGMGRINAPGMFDGNASCLFELDETYKAFSAGSRCFTNVPTWFTSANFFQIANQYGQAIQPRQPLGYKDGQMLIGFSHNTPDNTLPIFWDEGRLTNWSPVFMRYDKQYG